MADLTAAFREVLDKLRVRYTEKGNRLEISCPFHQDNTPSSGVYKSTAKFYCFSCDLTLDAAQFYAKATGSDEVKTRTSLEDKYGQLSKGIPPEVRMEVARVRGGVELRLTQMKTAGITYRGYNRATELVDRLVSLFETLDLEKETFDKCLEIWYNIEVEEFEGESLAEGHAEQNGAARVDLDDWIPQGIADLFRARESAIRSAMEAARTSGSNGFRSVASEGSDLIELT